MHRSDVALREGRVGGWLPWVFAVTGVLEGYLTIGPLVHSTLMAAAILRSVCASSAAARAVRNRWRGTPS
jgi:hypothetical protein